MLKDCLRPKDFYRDIVHVQTGTPKCPNTFNLLRLLQIFAAILFFTVAGISQVNAQTAVVTASTPTPSPGQGTVTYSASVSTTNPTLNSEQQITNVTYAWGSSDSCNPTTSSSTTVTATRTSPGSYSSSVGCTVTWYIYNTSTKNTTTVSASGGASVSYKLGVLWSKGTITGKMASPQNQAVSPATPSIIIVTPGQELTCSLSGVSATDTSTFTYGSTTVTGSGSDTLSYAWTASAGTLGSASSASTSWTAPSTAQSGPITLSCTISANAPAVVSPDGGTRGPSPITVTVNVYFLPTLSVSGGSWSPNPADVGDIITCNATATTSTTIPGTTDNVTWASNGCYQSVDGSDPFTPYSGSSGWVYTQGSLTTSFTAFFDAPGYYLIGVGATDTLKDSSGNSVGTISGSGFVGGGTLADVAPPNGTYGGDDPSFKIGAHAEQAHTLQAHDGGAGGNPNGVPAVTIGQVEYTDPKLGTTVPATGVLYIIKGQSVTFTAIPNPVGAAFKGGEPSWGGSSGASGSSATCSVTFSTLSTSSTDYKTVTATAGSATVTVNVIVYQAGLSETFPDAQVTNHDPNNIGVGEEADCFPITNPPGIPDQGLTLALVGATPVTGSTTSWTAQDGETCRTDGTGLDVFGGYSADTMTISITPSSGPSDGQATNASIGVEALTSGSEVLGTPPSYLHVQNSASAGFFATIQLTGGANVGYSNANFLEEDVKCVASGMFANLNGLSHLNGTTSLVPNASLPSYGLTYSGTQSKWNSASRSGSGDEVYFKGAGTYQTGSATSSIPWAYKLTNDENNANLETITTVTQSATSDASGNTSASKASAQSPTYAPSDASVGSP